MYVLTLQVHRQRKRRGNGLRADMLELREEGGQLRQH